MNKEQVKELAEINATYTFDRATKQYGKFTDEYVRHFYNKLAELRSEVDDVHTCNCQHSNNPRDNKPCCRCDNAKTNADRIRSMSDEELAEWLSNMTDDFGDDEELYKSIYNLDTQKVEDIHHSYGDMLNWLQTPIEDVTSTEKISARS